MAADDASRSAAPAGAAHARAGSSPTASRSPGATSQHVRQIPEKLIDVTLQPIMFVLLFAYVFGGVIDVPDGDYREYLIGGILVQTIAFGMMGPGASIATDLGEGMVDRIRSLPTSRSAYLVGPLRWPSWPPALLGDRRPLPSTGLVVGWRIDGERARTRSAGFGAAARCSPSR